MVRTYEQYDPHWNPLIHHRTWHLPLQKLLTSLRARANWISVSVPYIILTHIIYLTFDFSYWDTHDTGGATTSSCD